MTALRLYSREKLVELREHWNAAKANPDTHADALRAIRKINDEIERRA